jgi:uncharacterized membrane protein
MWLSLLAVGLIVWTWRKSSEFKRLRVTALMILAVLLLKPAMDLLEDRSARPRLAVLVDVGPSMQSPDDLGLSRLKRAGRWLAQNRSRLERGYETVFYAAAGGARRVEPKDLESLAPQNSALDLGSALADVLDSGSPPARVLLLSDGAFEDSRALDAALTRLSAPVDALGVGPRTAKPALAVAQVQAPDFVFQHSRFSVSASVEASELPGSRVRLRLLKGSRVVEEQEKKVEKSFEVLEASFTALAESLGREDYRVEAQAVPAGVKSARGLGVEVIRQKYRIMLLAGRPSFEYSYLREYLKSDPNHELVSFVILRNPENVSPVPDNELSLIPFPAQEIFVQNLRQFDLFILEDFHYGRFSLPAAYLQNLRSFVAEGGALLLIGGANAFTKAGYQGTPLEDVLPVSLWPDADDYRPGLFQPAVSAPDHPMLNLGETAEDSAQLWRRIPPLDGWTRLTGSRPGASVLLRHPAERAASGEGLPIVAVREFGRGKVMLVGSDSTWRWKLGGGKDWRLASFYPRFWSRAVEYLTGSLQLKKVKFSPLPEHMPSHEPAVFSLRVFDEHFRPLPSSEVDLRVLWRKPDGSQKQVAFYEREPGLFQVELTGLPEGRHVLEASAKRNSPRRQNASGVGSSRERGELWGADQVSFLWEAPRADAPLDRRRLKSVAEKSGGRYADLDRADPAAWSGDEQAQVRRERAVLGRRSLWTSAAWFWIIGVLLTAEWFLRRRKGLL